jgi:hypothetical protein
MIENQSGKQSTPKQNSGQSFVRWQAITREQLTYAINLILGLSVAALGYELSLALNSKFSDLICANELAFSISCAFITTSVLSVFALLVSVGVGIWVILNRLVDFRLTQEIARHRENGAMDEDLNIDRERSRVLGERTWCLFKGQICSFAAGIFFAVFSVLAHTVLKII